MNRRAFLAMVGVGPAALVSEPTPGLYIASDEEFERLRGRGVHVEYIRPIDPDRGTSAFRVMA